MKFPRILIFTTLLTCSLLEAALPVPPPKPPNLEKVQADLLAKAALLVDPPHRGRSVRSKYRCPLPTRKHGQTHDCRSGLREKQSPRNDHNRP